MVIVNGDIVVFIWKFCLGIWLLGIEGESFELICQYEQIGINKIEVKIEGESTKRRI